jgi:cold shock CspA family protein
MSDTGTAAQHLNVQRVAPQRGVPANPRGIPATGRIVKLCVGQGHGFIRVADRRNIYFHRADLAEGTPFRDFVVGDAVVFELLEDRFSGPRGLKVRHRPR